MYKIAILGCENSHANSFLSHIRDTQYKDKVEVVGVYSHEREAAEKLSAEYGVKIAEDYDEFVGKVDAIIITARHGDNHYKYAKPYLACGIPMFIDKPITCSEQDARAFKRDLQKHNIRVSGGSSCIFADKVAELKKAVAEKTYGEIFGAYLRAPIVLDSPHGGFFFYSQHLAQIAMEIFGYYPESVTAKRVGKTVKCTLRYTDDLEIDLCYTHNYWSYYAAINCEKGVFGDNYKNDGAFAREFEEFYSLLEGKPMPQSYDDFFAPVYVINALHRALQSGKSENVNKD